MKHLLPYAALVVALTSGVQAQNGAVKPAKIEIHLAKTTFGADEPVDLEVDLINTSDKPLEIGGSAFENSAFQVEVRDERGAVVKKTREGERSFEPRNVAFANIALIIEPKNQQKTHFRLSNLFDLSAGGSFSVQVSRSLVTGMVPVKRSERDPKWKLQPEFRLESVLLKASPSSFIVAKAPLTRTLEDAAPFPARAKWLLCLNGGEIARFRIGDDGALGRTRRAATSIPQNCAAMVASPDGRFVYTIRQNTIGKTANGGYDGQNDGAILSFQVEEDGFLTPLGPPTPLPNNFSTLVLDAARHRLISYTAFQNGHGYRDGGRAFLIESDGKLTPQPNFQLDGTSTLTLSSDGTLAFTSETTFEVLPDGQFSRLSHRPWRAPSARGTTNWPGDVWNSPDGKFLVGQINRQNLLLPQADEKVRETFGLVMYRLDPDAAPDALVTSVPGFFTALDGDALVSTKGIGFDPSGQFFLAQSARGALLSFRVEPEGALKLADSFEAHLKFSFNYGHEIEDQKAIFDAGGRTFWTLGGGAARAFRLGTDGKISAMGLPLCAWGRDFVIASTPVSTFTTKSANGAATSATLNGEVFDQGEKIALDFERAAPSGAQISVEYEGQSWQVEKDAVPVVNIPRLLAAVAVGPFNTFRVTGATGRTQIALSRLFDVSQTGIYRLRIEIPGAQALVLPFEVRPIGADAPFGTFGENNS